MCQPSRLPAQALYRLLLLPLPAAHTSSSSVRTGCRLEPKALSCVQELTAHSLTARCVPWPGEVPGRGSWRHGRGGAQF